MTMATDYSNKQNLENHWLPPGVLKVLSAAGSQQSSPSWALAWSHPPMCFLGLGSIYI